MNKYLITSEVLRNLLPAYNYDYESIKQSYYNRIDRSTNREFHYWYSQEIEPILPLQQQVYRVLMNQGNSNSNSNNTSEKVDMNPIGTRRLVEITNTLMITTDEFYRMSMEEIKVLATRRMQQVSVERKHDFTEYINARYQDLMWQCQMDLADQEENEDDDLMDDDEEEDENPGGVKKKMKCFNNNKESEEEEKKKVPRDELIDLGGFSSDEDYLDDYDLDDLSSTDTDASIQGEEKKEVENPQKNPPLSFPLKFRIRLPGEPQNPQKQKMVTPALQPTPISQEDLDTILLSDSDDDKQADTMEYDPRSPSFEDIVRKICSFRVKKKEGGSKE